MATATMKRPWLDQPDWTPQQPDPSTLDTSKMAFVFDPDLDELTVLYYGKERRHTVHPVTPLSSALIDPVTGEAVGIMYGQFLRTYVSRDPKIALVLMFAAILSGGQVSEPVVEGLEEEPERQVGFWKRVVRAYDVLRGADPPSIAEQKRQSLAALLPLPS